MELIKQLQLPATPRNYELCYAYATGEFPTVNIAINDLLKRPDAVSEQALEEIAARYVSHGCVKDELYAIGERVATEVERVIGSIDTMTETIGACAGDLANANEATLASQQRDALIASVGRLLQSSSRVEGEKRRLEAELNQSNAEIQKLRNELQRLSDTGSKDPLTGLPNRHQFRPLLQEAIAEAARRGAALCVALADIDEFADFNETWGYDRGDQVLRLVTAEIKQKVRPADVVVRSGGAQFAIIQTGTSLNEADVLGDHIRRSVMLREVTIRSTGQALGRIGLSFGIASARPDDTADALAERARTCLRSAKALGRNRVICENDPVLTRLQGDAKVA